MGEVCLQISHQRLQTEDEGARSQASVALLHDGEALFVGSTGEAPVTHTRAGRGSVSAYSGPYLIESFLCLQLAPKETVEP